MRLHQRRERRVGRAQHQIEAIALEQFPPPGVSVPQLHIILNDGIAVIVVAIVKEDALARVVRIDQITCQLVRRVDTRGRNLIGIL